VVCVQDRQGLSRLSWEMPGHREQPSPSILRNRFAAQCIDAGRKASKAMINDVARDFYRCGCCTIDFHCDYGDKVWFLRNDISLAHPFEATASLYLWACIKARESFQLRSSESIELARVIWGDQITDTAADDLVTRSISELRSAGRCAVECFDDRSIATDI